MPVGVCASESGDDSSLLGFLSAQGNERFDADRPSGQPAHGHIIADLLYTQSRGELRLLARRTWDFFETFVGPSDHWLPPDNYQEIPQPKVAHRTSPTNMGLLLVSTLAAHDLGYLGVDRARMNRAVFAALKPGGLYVVADHSGRPGTGITESGTLHRVEEAFVRQEIEAAGFRLAESGNFLRNPNDPRDRNTPEPPMPKDEFVLKFVKPL